MRTASSGTRDAGRKALFVGFSSYQMQHVYARCPRRFAFRNTFDKVVGFALVAVLFPWLGPVA